jgi:hypothetical protein
MAASWPGDVRPQLVYKFRRLWQLEAEVCKTPVHNTPEELNSTGFGGMPFQHMNGYIPSGRQVNRPSPAYRLVLAGHQKSGSRSRHDAVSVPGPLGLMARAAGWGATEEGIFAALCPSRQGSRGSWTGRRAGHPPSQPGEASGVSARGRSKEFNPCGLRSEFSRRRGGERRGKGAQSPWPGALTVPVLTPGTRID